MLTRARYDNLGIHWASTVPAFLALACVPFPFLFYKYGKPIREKCKYAAEAAAFMTRMREAQYTAAPVAEQKTRDTDTSSTEVETETRRVEQKENAGEAYAEQEAVDYSYETEGGEEGERFQKIRPGGGLARSQTASSFRSIGGTRYESNPYDIDRVNTRESFSASRLRANSTMGSSEPER